MIKLNEEKLPGLLPAPHRCQRRGPCGGPHLHLLPTRKRTQAPPTTGWIPQECYAKLYRHLHAAATRARTMYVIPYSMGPVGSPFAKIGVELTDSIYVVLNMAIMTRVGTKVLEALGDSNDLVKRPALQVRTSTRRSVTSAHFPEDNTIMVRQLRLRRKRAAGQEVLCSAHRLLPGHARRAGWLSICSSWALRIPQGEVKYVAAAFPSACGKTNLAMLIPPEDLQQEGLQGLDASATTSPGCASARTAACGPSTPRTASSALPPAPTRSPTPTRWLPPARAPSSPTCAHNLDDNTVWWEGLDKNPPKNALNWKGEPWDGNRQLDEKGAHPELPLHRSCQATAPASPRSSTTRRACRFPPSSSAAAAPRPLRWFTSPATGSNGVFVGSIMASETTAAATGAVGVVRRDPMAMLSLLRLPHGRLLRSTGSRWARSCATRLRRSSTSTGSAPTQDGQLPVAGLRRQPPCCWRGS